MLDKSCLALLNIINAQCENCSYKIFSIDYLQSEMPIELGVDKGQIVKNLLTLSNGDYISVKYQDDSEICVCSLKKGRAVFENASLKKDKEDLSIDDRKPYFFFAFLGGALGAFFATLFFNLIKVFI